MQYFDIKKDLTHPCWCEACIVGKKQREMSLDPRYCQGCYELLVADAELQKGGTRRPSWIPRPSLGVTILGGEKPKHSLEDTHKENAIKSTSNEKHARVDKIRPSPLKRGRKQRKLPEELIRQLHDNEGLGSKAIATKLKEQGITVSYKTIQRLLATPPAPITP